MTIGHDVILVVYAIATAVAVVLGAVVWRHRKKTGAIPLTVIMVSAVLWAGSLFVATAVGNYAISAFVKRFLFVGVVMLVAANFLFVLEYTGRKHLVTRKTVVLLSIEPILVVAFAFLNPGNLFYESIHPDPTAAVGVGAEMGVAFDLHLVYSYLLTLAGTAMILELLYSSRSLYRGQAAALFGATTLPLFTNVIYVFGVFGPIKADTTPIGFIAAGALYSIAIVHYRLIDIVPIARDRVLDSVKEGIFVVDREDRLIDVNPTGRVMLDLDPETAIVGRSVDSLFRDEPEVLDHYHELTETPEESITELTIGDTHFEVRVSPIDDGRSRHVGWLVLVHDITVRKRREQELESQNERLDRFASLLSHDLRNPLNVASGYVDIARETGDTSNLDRVEDSHDRMETIIDDVLALTRDGNVVTDPEPVAIATLADRAWEGVETGTATLSLDANGTVLADGDRTIRLLENLLRNSIEHGTTSARSQPTDDGTDGVVDPSTPLEITVGTIGDDGAIEGFYVEDDGVGIPLEDRDRVFEDGYTTDDAGTGLGLSIVDQIADAHGWSVRITESGSGGVRFEFTAVERAPPKKSSRAPR